MPRNREELQEINAGSMADIAFLLLVFFLVTTTMEKDSGINRKLPPMPDENNKELEDIHKRNIYVVLVNNQDKILAGQGYPTEIVQINNGVIAESLKEDLVDFIDNRGNVSEFSHIYKPNINADIASSDNPRKAIISLQNQNKTSYGMYIQVQDILTEAYNDLRDKESKKRFGIKFNELNEENKEVIKNYYPMKVSEAELRE